MRAVGAQQAFSHSKSKELKRHGERIAATLDGGPAEVPAPYSYRPLADGGYAFYFAEPAFPIPTDFFYVWDASGRRWVYTEYADLP